MVYISSKRSHRRCCKGQDLNQVEKVEGMHSVLSNHTTILVEYNNYTITLGQFNSTTLLLALSIAGGHPNNFPFCYSRKEISPFRENGILTNLPYQLLVIEAIAAVLLFSTLKDTVQCVSTSPIAIYLYNHFFYHGIMLSSSTNNNKYHHHRSNIISIIILPT